MLDAGYKMHDTGYWMLDFKPPGVNGHTEHPITRDTDKGERNRSEQ